MPEKIQIITRLIELKKQELRTLQDVLYTLSFGGTSGSGVGMGVEGYGSQTGTRVDAQITFESEQNLQESGFPLGLSLNWNDHDFVNYFESSSTTTRCAGGFGLSGTTSLVDHVTQQNHHHQQESAVDHHHEHHSTRSMEHATIEPGRKRRRISQTRLYIDTMKSNDDERPRKLYTYKFKKNK